MTVQNQPSSTSVSWRINIAAEGVAAAQFARCGFDVSIQSGAGNPAYDMVATKAGVLWKVSIQSSQDGAWNLTQSYLRRADEQSGKKDDYHGAIGLWLDHHASCSVCSLVQFLGVEFDQLPRLYLATPQEIARRLAESAGDRGDTTLYEGLRLDGAHSPFGVEPLPAAWRFTLERVQQLLAQPSARAAQAESSPFSWNSAPVLPIRTARQVA
jgi:hypothetical protein